MPISGLSSGVFYGTAIRRTIVGDLLLIQTRYAPGVLVGAHWHERSYFCYVERGAFDEQSGGSQRRHSAGSLIFHPAGETHADRFSEEGGVCINIEVPPHLLASCEPPELARIDGAIDFRAGPANRLAAQLAREFRRLPGSSALVLEGLALALVGEACRTRPPGAHPQAPHWMGRAVELLHDRFREPIGLGSVAADLGVHPVHLARTFRKHRGTTVGEYIRSLRIDFARAALADRRMTIAEIAHASGFADHAHFCRSFRAHVGMSPSRFRAQRGGQS